MIYIIINHCTRISDNKRMRKQNGNNSEKNISCMSGNNLYAGTDRALCGKDRKRKEGQYNRKSGSKGGVVRDGDWIYYIQIKEWYSYIYRMKTDGTKKQQSWKHCTR